MRTNEDNVVLIYPYRDIISPSRNPIQTQLKATFSIIFWWLSVDFVLQHHCGGEVHRDGGGVHSEHDTLSYAYDGHHAHLLKAQDDEVERLNA